MGKDNSDILSQTTGTGLPGTGTISLLAAASVAAAEEPQGLPVFIPLLLISPASALPGDCLFI